MSRGMNRTASTIGMMDSAFFVPRTELLQWVNETLQVNLTKVEQCASGAVYCQVIDSCHPGTVAMRKVNWMAKSDHEFIPNFKVLQTAFDKHDIKRHIEVEKLIRAKYQDNLEFLQWVKCYWERQTGGNPLPDYDPVAVRQGSAQPPWTKQSGCQALGGSRQKENVADNVFAQPVDAAKKAPALGQRRAPPKTTPRPTSAVSSTATGRKAEPADPRAFDLAAERREMEELRQLHTAQKEELETMRGSLQGLEDERDYYFGKLREIEILSTTLEASPDSELTVKKVLDDVNSILYREAEDTADDEA